MRVCVGQDLVRVCVVQDLVRVCVVHGLVGVYVVQGVVILSSLCSMWVYGHLHCTRFCWTLCCTRVYYFVNFIFVLCIIVLIF